MGFGSLGLELRKFLLDAYRSRNPVIPAVRHFIDVNQQIYAILLYRKKTNREVREWLSLTKNGRKYEPLNHDEKELILKLYKEGASIYSIAKKLNRHPSTIYYFIKRAERKHLL